MMPYHNTYASQKIKVDKIKHKIESFIFTKLKDDTCQIIEIPAIELLTWNRFDLAFKLLYLDLKKQNKKLGEIIYKHNIRSHTLGTYIEPGNLQKSSFHDYLDDFNKTYTSIQQDGFDSQRSLVPLAIDDSIINGAHRVACSIHQKKNVTCVKLNLPEMICDYKYFNERNVPPLFMDFAAVKFIEYSQNVYLAFLWPSCRINQEKIKEKFKNIVYKKEISLSPRGAINLLVELYKHMDWVGNESNGFPGIKQKLLECFTDFREFTVIAFQANNISDVKELKKKIRNICNIGFSSIHITDNTEEANRIAKLIFNKNGLHFLNYSFPYKYKGNKQTITKFTDTLTINGINPNDTIIDGSFILALYGLRKNIDIDFLTTDNITLLHDNSLPESHDNEIVYHKKSKLDIIYDPNNYFEYIGLKFVSLQQLYKMKKNRSEYKDVLDCKLMDNILSENNFKTHIIRVKHYLLYTKYKSIAKLQSLIKSTLTQIGMYSITRQVYRKMLSSLLSRKKKR